jgi:hypothetical protein
MSNTTQQATLAITYLILTEASNKALITLEEPASVEIESTLYNAINQAADKARESAKQIAEGLTEDQRETLIHIYKGWVLKLDDLIEAVRRLA